MAWKGEIVGVHNRPDGWLIEVDYFNDVTPERKFQRSINLPSDATKAQAVAAIQARGAEIRARINLSDEKLVGTIIPIP